MKSLRQKIVTMAVMVAISGLMMASVAGAADKLMVKDSTGATKAVITDSGYLGLGDATAPAAIFNAKGSTSYSSQLLLQREETNASAGAGFLAYHNNAGMVLPSSGDRLGYFLFGSYYKDTTNQYGGGVNYLWAKNGGGIAARAEGAWSYTSNPTYFTFETAPVNSTTRTERLRISSAGNIVAGNNGGVATGDLGTTANDGFLYIPSVAGALTSCSTATSYAGHVPVWFDKTNAKICTCQSGALRCTAALN